jgi:hypothetical protein
MSLRFASEEIVGVATGVDLGNHITGLPTKCREFRWTPEHDKNALTFSVERHWKVSAVSEWPSCPPQATSRVKHGNRPVIWQVYKYLVRSGIELKTFRMGF